MFEKSPVLTTIVSLCVFGGAIFLAVRAANRAIERKWAAVVESQMTSVVQEQALFETARKEVISMALDESTRNYYLTRLDEQAKGYLGGLEGVKETVAEARSRSNKK